MSLASKQEGGYALDRDTMFVLVIYMCHVSYYRCCLCMYKMMIHWLTMNIYWMVMTARLDGHALLSVLKECA